MHPARRAGRPGQLRHQAVPDRAPRRLIPYVDAHFRTLADADHRAMAGLSMGGFETKLITTAKVGTFGYVGLFSGGTFSVEDVANAPGFRDKVKLVFRQLRQPRARQPRTRPQASRGRSRGQRPGTQGVRVQQRLLRLARHRARVPVVAASLREFAPLLFRD
jgi:hypothetical protein